MPIRRIAFVAFLLFAVTLCVSFAQTQADDSGNSLLAFLNQSIDWYHRVQVPGQLSNDPSDSIYTTYNRNASLQAVSLILDFGRIQAEQMQLDHPHDAPAASDTAQPPQPHQHWHIDISYINLSGTFYYLCSVLDGFSRFLLHWDLRESMTEAEIEVILERAKEKYPEAKPRIISDNGPQFIARDFKEFIRISGMTHVRTSPYYPQSNGKLERWHKSLKTECIRPGTPLTREDAVRLIQTYVDHYNTVRLHSAIGYVTPQDMLAGRQAEIHAERDRKLEEARRLRQLRRLHVATPAAPRLLAGAKMASPGETEAGNAGMQPC